MNKMISLITTRHTLHTHTVSIQAPVLFSGFIGLPLDVDLGHQMFVESCCSWLHEVWSFPMYRYFKSGHTCICRDTECPSVPPLSDSDFKYLCLIVTFTAGPRPARVLVNILFLITWAFSKEN